MRARISLAIVVAVLLAFGLAACQRARSDAQIAADVQSKINSDSAVQSRQYEVKANNGVITLAGFVGSDAERAAAANDAAQVEGVRTVVNNLQTSQPTVANAQPAAEQAAQAAPEEPAPASTPRQRERSETRAVRHNKPIGFSPGSRRPSNYGDNSLRAQNGSEYNSQPASTYTGSNTSAPVNTPPPPPRVVDVTIPEGTTVSIRLIDPIDSERNQPGDRFRATLDSPIVVSDHVAIPAGADVYGRVTNVKSAAHFAGRSELALELTRVSLNGKSYDLHTDQFSRQGKARGKNTAEKVGGGAALGAIIGGIAGGGKGAAIGATIGAGAGGTAQAVTHGEQIKLTSEQVIAFHLESPLTVTPSSRLDRESGRQKLDIND